MPFRARARARVKPRIAMSGRAVVGAVIAVCSMAAVAPAQVITPFSVRYSTNDTGDIAIIGNTLMTCQSSASGCVAGQGGTGSVINNNNFTMINVDVDTDATTFNSSRATLNLPAGSTVLFAGLYWGADTSAGSSGSAAPNAAIRNQVRFLTPVSAGYLNRTGTQVGLSGTRYHAFDNVTALVQAGGNGIYGVANVQAGTGGDRYAGWSLVVVYRAPSQPPRNLTVLDGYALVNSGTPNVNVPVSGFTTPPAGPVNTRLGVVAYEGDLGLVGDSLRLNSVTLSDALNPADNFFNSSIARLGTRISAKSPDYINQLGFGLDVVDASGILANSSTSATINLTTSGDAYFPGVVTFATELFAPSIPATKTVVDLNGGDVQPGDILEYTVALTNVGQDPATSVVLLDNIPANTTYVPGTMQVVTGPNAGAKTDSAGDDQAEFDGINNRVVFRLGTGANAASGGTLAVMASTSIRFRVAVNLAIGNGTVITNQASISYVGQTLGGGFSGASTAPSSVVLANPVLSASKTYLLLVDNDFNGFPSPGDVLRYTTVISNTGTAFANGVVFNDFPDVNTSLVPASVTTTQGVITSGNAGTPPVAVNLGVIPNGSSATVTFDVTINLLPAGVDRVTNQGTVTSNELPAVLTDDPTVGGNRDATVTLVTGAPNLVAEKTAVRVIDADLDGQTSPGDRLEYNIVIRNIGTAGASSVVLSDIPGVYTALVVGSVTTSQGAITSGNGPGDTAVGVNLGVIAAGATATVSFRVDIANPVPNGVTQVSNQGQVASAELPARLTDDPAVAGPANPTRTSIVSAPLLLATKSATLDVDADADGVPSPGDTLLYRVRITNSGNSAATSVVFRDTPDANTAIVPGSVQTDIGTVVSGNAGAPPIVVDVGTLVGGGATATITFRVTIASPLPAGVTTVSNQGTVESAEIPLLFTDDPAVSGPTAPTVTTVAAAPRMIASKRAIHLIDANSSGVPSPGDTLLYTVSLTNQGNTAGTAVFVNDLLDANLTLIAGTVQTSQGMISSGNGPGDTSVVVDVGTLPGGGATALISFRALINNPLPANVTTVSNQALVTGANFPTLLSDDPTTLSVNDPTVTVVASAVRITATKVAVLAIDADLDGVPSPGDTLLYQLDVYNSGNQDAQDVVLIDTPDPSTALVVGSVQANPGSVAAGNASGDTAVVVSIGTLPGGARAVASFRVQIADPLSPGVTSVRNQMFVSGANFPTEASDDPGTATPNDPTVTQVTAAPSGTAEKTATLYIDTDADGLPSPGDTLLYTIRVRNTGNTAATGAVLNDVPDLNAPLIAGTVQASQGVITSGNTAGDTSVSINIGTIPGRGGEFVATFQVLIADPLPPGVFTVSNQAVGSSNELPLVATDDPTTATPNDATVTQVTAAPAGRADKTAVLFVDADGNGVASPGDTLLYRIEVVNTGNIAATGAYLTDTVDPNTELVVGSVQTNLGTITAGNNPGDTSVAISIGTIPGRGGSFVATFLATIDNPLPSGVDRVANQALGGSNEIPFVVTNDPSTPAPNDATVTYVAAAPVLRVTKTDTLVSDADGNGVPSPGDTIGYIISIANLGNTDATGVALSDLIDPNAALIVGSVQTTQGVVTLGNSPGDTDVAVTIGTILPGAAPVTVSFQVVVDDPLAPGVDFLSNQAFVSSNELPVVASHDPDTPTLADEPTITPVTAVPAGRADKSVALHIDADGDGVPSPGDTLLYTIEVANTGNGAATGATAADLLDPNTTLVVGSVQASQGVVTSGNNPGDTSVAINVGTVAARTGVFTASYLATINNPLPAGVSVITNQATGATNEIPFIVTNDPTTPAPNDPTTIAVTARPELVVQKVDALLVDADASGGPSAGDTLQYAVTITNQGNIAATGVSFTDLPDPLTAIVPGSIVASQGVVVSGNAGIPPVEVQLGTIPGGGGSATVVFAVDVADPLPIGATVVSNQGVVRSNELPDLLSDDPDTPADSDPTLTQVIAAPYIRVSKSASLAVDADGNGFPSPGDTLQYDILIRNDGSQPGVATLFDDTPGAFTELVVGSVVTSQGVVTSGNGVGDTSVAVSVGNIAANGGTVTVSFLVVVADALPESVDEVVNQAFVSGSNFASQPSGDPATAAPDDPTRTPIRPVPAISAAKAAVLAIDADNNGIPTAGDTLLYSVTLRNVGNLLADDIVFSDVPDANTTIVAGSVRTSRGLVLNGNAGTPPILIAVGDLPRGATATISFEVTVNSPLPLGVVEVANQGTVSGVNFAPTVTDDPRTSAVDDPTVTFVGPDPVLTAMKTVALTTDADGNGQPSSGDTITYTIEIRNFGNAIASGVSFDDTPDVNTTLVPGSVTTTGGIIVSGNAGVPPVSVNVGSLAGAGGTVVITFAVTINGPLPVNTTAVSNQGSVTGSNFPAQVTDDPNTAAPDDATVLGVNFVDVSIVKTNNGAFRVGETGRYTLHVRNNGSQPTSGTITVVDSLPNGLTLVSAVGVGWTCGNAGQVVTCTRNLPVAVGATTQILLDVAVGAAAFPTVTNVATVQFAGDSNAANNTAQSPTTVRAGAIPSPTSTSVVPLPPTATPGGPTSTPVPTATPTLGPPPDLALSKSHVGAFTVGSTGIYTLLVRNLGRGPTTGPVTITDNLPPGLRFAGAAGAGWNCDAVGQTVTCIALAALPAGASSSLTLTVDVLDEAFPTVTNIAVVTTPRDTSANNNQANDPTTVRRGSGVTPVVPSPTPATGTPGAAGTPTPSLTPSRTAIPTRTPIPTRTGAPCSFVLSKTHPGKVRAGNVTRFRLTWSHTCADGGTITIVDTLPEGMVLGTVSALSSTQVSVDGRQITLRAPRRAGVDSATIRVMVDQNVAPDSTLCNEAVGIDAQGRESRSQACARVEADGTAQVLLLRGHTKSRPGRMLTYTARYFNVPASNTLTLTLPEYVQVLEIADPKPTRVEGRTYTWENLPPVSGKVLVTVLLDPELDFGIVLPATAELVSSRGRATASHSTDVVLPGRN